MLGVYLTAPLIIIGWIACTILFFGGQTFLPTLTAFFLASTCYNAFETSLPSLRLARA
jgi:hypothetical protein